MNMFSSLGDLCALTDFSRFFCKLHFFIAINIDLVIQLTILSNEKVSGKIGFFLDFKVDLFLF